MPSGKENMKAVALLLILFGVGNPASAEKKTEVLLDKTTARTVIMNGLDLIVKKDERIFALVMDSELVMQPDQIKKILRYDESTRQDYRYWRQLFPGYASLPSRDIRGIRIEDAFGPFSTDVRLHVGGTPEKPQWKIVKGTYLRLVVRIPQKKKAKQCKVYLVEGNLYWEPFGW